jgi:hypothetical protein
MDKPRCRPISDDTLSHALSRQHPGFAGTNFVWNCSVMNKHDNKGVANSGIRVGNRYLFYWCRRYDQPSPKWFQCISKARRAKRFARFWAHSHLNCRFEGGISARGEPSGEDICRGPRAAAARNFAPLRAKLRTVLSE